MWWEALRRMRYCHFCFFTDLHTDTAIKTLHFISFYVKYSISKAMMYTVAHCTGQWPFPLIFSLYNFLMDLFFYPIFSWCWCQYWTACLSLSVKSSGESSFMSRNNFRNVLIVSDISISSILWGSGQIQLCVSSCTLNHQQAAADVVTMGTDAGVMQNVSSSEYLPSEYPNPVVVSRFPYWTLITNSFICQVYLHTQGICVR